MQHSIRPPAELIQVPVFSLPEKGRYEANATIFQKRKLEQCASSDSGLPDQFYEIMDSPGREQAQYILDYCEIRQYAKQQADRLAAEALASQRAQIEQERSARYTPLKIIAGGLWIVGTVYGVLWFNGYAHPTAPDTVVPSPVTQRAIQTNAPSAANKPSVNKVTAFLGTPTFQTRVKSSQQAAVRKYPALGVPSTTTNTKFLARYGQWKAKNDPRLSRPDWPEVLADNCAMHP